MLCIFLVCLFPRAGKFKLPIRKRVKNLIFANKIPKRLIFYRAYNKNEGHKYSRSEFYSPEDLTQRLNQASANVNTIL